MYATERTRELIHPLDYICVARFQKVSSRRVRIFEGKTSASPGIHSFSLNSLNSQTQRRLPRFECVFFAFKQPGDIGAMAVNDQRGNKQAEHAER